MGIFQIQRIRIIQLTRANGIHFRIRKSLEHTHEKEESPLLNKKKQIHTHTLLTEDERQAKWNWKENSCLKLSYCISVCT